MSLFSALNTSVSGLTAQSAAFANISDNVANSQSDGYKAVDTSFIDYLTTSTPTENEPGAVVTRPDYTNTVQGTISQSSDPLALAISGQGFFAVSVPSGVQSGSGAPVFNPQTYYTRLGDFTLDKNGYLVNSGGAYLQGWSVNPQTGAVNQSALGPIQINETQFNPVPTANVTLSANLPTSGGAGPFSSQVDVYDALGNQHTLTLSWTPNAAANSWTLNIYQDASPNPTATATVDFGTNGVAAGTIGDMSTATPGAAASAFAAGASATLSFSANFGQGAQPITLDLGNYGEATGVTQYASSSYSLRTLSQDGVPPGSFTGLTMSNTGDVVANYNNGQSQVVAQVPVITFANADALQRQNAQQFTATNESGPAIAQTQNTNGAGSLVTSSVEGSNVDIASEFSKLIVAQEAYSANAKLITSADNMLQVTINMKT
ncbi:MAG TPA: flagellar hook protein FlgE [Acetobacteraceae bacterium]|nr:flagellar hook protein FlgE [Acetobacteraceae bacterium]